MENKQKKSSNAATDHRQCNNIDNNEFTSAERLEAFSNLAPPTSPSPSVDSAPSHEVVDDFLWIPDGAKFDFQYANSYCGDMKSHKKGFKFGFKFRRSGGDDVLESSSGGGDGDKRVEGKFNIFY